MEGKEVLDSRIAYQITSILSDEQARPGEFWRTQLTIPGFQTAAKTGTSSKCVERDEENDKCKLLKPDNTLLCISRKANETLAAQAKMAGTPLLQWTQDLAQGVIGKVFRPRVADVPHGLHLTVGQGGEYPVGFGGIGHRQRQCKAAAAALLAE